jgi:hypothetical protein
MSLNLESKTFKKYLAESEQGYSYKGFEIKRETYFKFIEMKEQISKEDMEDILDMAQQLNDFEQAFNDYVEAIN